MKFEVEIFVPIMDHDILKTFDNIYRWNIRRIFDLEIYLIFRIYLDCWIYILEWCFEFFNRTHYTINIR